MFYTSGSQTLLVRGASEQQVALHNTTKNLFFMPSFELETLTN
jgi:hypothetical protein